jgi:hypothetical protein
MSFTPNDIIRRASTTLQDQDHVRWTVADLVDWTNAGLIDIPTIKPNATNETIEISLEAGTRQDIPDGALALVRPIRNLATVAADPEGRTGGTPITVVERADLDSAIPRWHDPDVVPFSAVVQHVTFDVDDPTAYYVMPGNDGTGIIEAVVTTTPDPVSADELEDPIDLDDRYQNALVDYVLFRAFSVDAPNPNGAARAEAHLQLYHGALGFKAQSEAASSPNLTSD